MSQTIDVDTWEKLKLQVVREAGLVDDLLAYLSATIIGQEALLERLLIGLFGNGHILLEGFPGLAKTLAAKTLAQSIHAQFNRIQFTPDLLPADILGTMVYNMHTNEFKVRKGPVFSHFVLADEINRAPEKVQSALLEVMQEHQVTIGDTTYSLDMPFMVLATQNPIDQSGTYELPEAQMDRFMLKAMVSYPTLENERLIIRRNTLVNNIPPPAFDIKQVTRIQALVRDIHVDTKIESYILDIVFATRYPDKYRLQQLKPLIKFGSSPRGSISLAIAARAYAFLRKRAFVIPDDVKAIAHDVLRHRIGLTYNAIADNITTDIIIDEILKAIPLP